MRPIRKAFWLAGTMAVLALSLTPTLGLGQDTKTVSVISTSSVNGEVSPCG